MKTKENLITDLEKNVFNSSSVIKLESYAGTGKTTTLEEIFKYYPSKRILYLVFNASMKREAERRLSNQKNVKVSTLHGLAYPFYKNNYPNVELQNDITAMDIKEQFKIEDIKLACKILNDYKSFLASEHTLENLENDNILNELREIKELKEHEQNEDPYKEMYNPIDQRNNLEKEEDLLITYKFSKYVLRILNLQKEGELGFTHDTYLKLFQLSNPCLTNKYDIIAIDEAQDITMSTVKIFNDQQCMKIIVGDRYQNIYGFRRTTNALEIINTPFTYVLSKSYRIGQEIATLSSEILSKRYNTDVNITGVNVSKLSSRYDVSDNSKKYYIARKTITLLIEAKSLMEKGLSFNFIGGIETYGVKNALNLLKWGSIYYKGKKLTRSQIYEIFEETEDAELGVLISIERAFDSSEDLEELIQSEVSEKCADVVFTTAHRSKGLEWDTVFILDDFNLIEVTHVMEQVYNEDTKSYINKLIRKINVSDMQEYNLFYVAITRAKKDLVLEYKLNSQIDLIKEYL